MGLFFSLLACCLVCRFIWVSAIDAPEILNNGTLIDVEEDDIAHFTCLARGLPRPLIRWEKAGNVLKDKNEGIAILLSSNSTIEESHLFIAVTGKGRRGEYTCVVSNSQGVAKQTFGVKEVPSKLSTIDYAAIGISVGLGVFFLAAILILIWRGHRKMEQSRRNSVLVRQRTISQTSTQENNALQQSNADLDRDKLLNGDAANDNRKSTISMVSSV